VNLTVILPTYNEAQNLPGIIYALFEQPIADLQIHVVDDNSPDGTGDVAEALKLEYPGRISVTHRSGKHGLGSAYLEGFAMALEGNAHAIAQMDSDFSHPAQAIPIMLVALESCDIVLGSRYVEGGSVDVQWPIWRKGLSTFGNLYARSILSLPIQDATGGFRIWKRETLSGMPLERIRSNGYAFQIETAYVAYRLGYQFTEIPICFADRKWGKSKMSLRIQLEAALRVWQIRYVNRDLEPLSLLNIPGENKISS